MCVCWHLDSSILVLSSSCICSLPHLKRNQILHPSRRKHTQDRSTRRRHMPSCTGRGVSHTLDEVCEIFIKWDELKTQRKRNSSASVTESKPLNTNTRADAITRPSQGENNNISLSDGQTNDMQIWDTRRGSNMMCVCSRRGEIIASVALALLSCRRLRERDIERHRERERGSHRH